MPLIALALTGCATMIPEDGGVPSISYETGPCFGTCPEYKVTVNADGTGLFEGRRSTALTGEHYFTVTPRQYRAFVAHLAPIRPATGDLRYSGAPFCRQTATDPPPVEVTWRLRRGTQSLYFSQDCNFAWSRAIADRLNAAPGLLPIGDFIRTPR